MKHLTIIPDVVKDQELIVLPPRTSVREAARVMTERRIGAVMIVDGGRLIGIFTERDMITRIVAQGHDPDAVMLEDVMTAKPDTLVPGDSPRDALELMAKKGYRHLPVVENGAVIAIVSVRDLYALMVDRLQQGLVRMAERVMFG
ncbi:MAG: CBS domain-containing protein [Alphaproteobacteria bacterium]